MNLIASCGVNFITSKLQVKQWSFGETPCLAQGPLIRDLSGLQHLGRTS